MRIGRSHADSGWRGGWRNRRRRRRGVSEVVATIILLALTVVLFSAIFAFVTTFPSPPTQSNNQFQATLTYTTASGKVVVKSLNILHLAGPSVPSSALVYVKSAANPAGTEFQNPYNMSQGGISYGKPWNLGQTWTYTFPTGQQPSTPDNLTIYLVSTTSVLFSVVLPGQSFAVPPTFVAAAVSPGTPSVGSAFNISTTISGSVKANSVYVSLAGIWGFNSSVAQKMTYNSATGQYYLPVTSAIGTSTTPGTFYAFLNATGTSGLAASTSLAITFTSTGGSSSSSSFSVSTFLVPSTSSAFPQGQEAQSNLETPAALITYNGAATTTVSVGFFVNGTSGGRAWSAANYEWSSAGTPVTITGPTSVTIFSNAIWPVPSNASTFSYQATAVATGTNGVGSATGIYPFSPVLGGIWGWTCVRTGSCTTGFYNHAPSSCTNNTVTGTCPIFFATVWDNSTYSGTYGMNLYLNTSAGAKVLVVSGSGSITAGSSLTARAGISWTPTRHTLYVVTMVATVTTSIGSGTVTFAWDYYTST